MRDERHRNQVDGWTGLNTAPVPRLGRREASRLARVAH